MAGELALLHRGRGVDEDALSWLAREVQSLREDLAYWNSEGKDWWVFQTTVGPNQGEKLAIADPRRIELWIGNTDPLNPIYIGPMKQISAGPGPTGGFVVWPQQTIIRDRTTSRMPVWAATASGIMVNVCVLGVTTE
jgi:hypothetical protein